ncbi:MAG: SpoVG family protein, partial [Clostridiales Family XIII bacterium]|nr:SpoVG family protein [Clostridiales Family XIII bacterium]
MSLRDSNDISWERIDYGDHMRSSLSKLLALHEGEAYRSVAELAQTLAGDVRPVAAGNFLAAFPEETKQTHDYFYGVFDASVNPFENPEAFAALMYRKKFGELLARSDYLAAHKTGTGNVSIFLTPEAVSLIRGEIGLPAPVRHTPAEHPKQSQKAPPRNFSAEFNPGNGQSKERRNAVHIDAQVEPVEGKKRFRGRATITLNDAVTVEGLSIWAKNDGTMYVKMPEKDGLPKDFDGNRDLAYPLSGDFRREIQAKVLAEYGRAVEQRNSFSVQVFPSEGANKIRANATVTFENEFVITGVTVAENRDGTLFVGMPQRSHTNRAGEKVYKDVVTLPPHLKGELTAKLLESYAIMRAEKAGEEKNAARGTAGNPSGREKNPGENEKFNRDGEQQRSGLPAEYTPCPVPSFRRQNRETASAKFDAEI